MSGGLQVRPRYRRSGRTDEVASKGDLPTRHRSGQPIKRRGTETRFDIQGLRAFAVLSVLVYHLWPNALPGGFVGVDVFFVISGYLITAHLLREVTSTSKVRLGAFWARRAKRILPASSLVLLVTGAATLLVAPQTVWKQFFTDILSSTLYVQNWHLAASSVDYLAATNKPSPVQHYWSLSVEEQFYIVLPIVIVLLLLAARRSRLKTITLVRIVLGAVVVLSFAWCVAETRTAESIAYFSTATRAWEFGLGGLVSTVAIAVPDARGRQLRHVLAVIGAWIGVALLVVSLFAINGSTPFPGSAAALPVVGATLVVALGGNSGLERIGGFRPIAFVGRISYALYLWHFPLVVLVPFWTHHPLGILDKVAIVVVSLALASVTTVVIEEPLRFSGWMKSMRPLRVGLLGVVATAAVVSLSFSGLQTLNAQQARAQAAAEQLAGEHTACFGAASMIGFPKPCVDPALDKVLVPQAAALASNDDNRHECWGLQPDGRPGWCVLGPKTGYTKTLIAVGDSHSNNFIGAYEKIAEAYGWRIEASGFGGCFWTTSVQTAASGTVKNACNTWKTDVTKRIATMTGIDAVLVTHSSTDDVVIPTAGRNIIQETTAGLTAKWKVATDRGIPVLAIRDNPRPIPSYQSCVYSTPHAQLSACDNPKVQAFAGFDGQAAAVAANPLTRFIDLSKYECNNHVCPAVIGGVVVYRDTSHMTATFTESLAPYLGADIKQALASLGH